MQENGYDPNEEESYKQGLQAFKDKMCEEFLSKMGIKARDKGLWVKIYFKYNKHGLKIYVKNNMMLSLHDERRIREKLKKAMFYDDIAQFYLENIDDSAEGAGMGIALIIILLKAESIDPAFFRIFSSEEETTARVEIPFSEKYVGLRDKSDKKASSV